MRTKTRFSQNVSSLELWSLLSTYRNFTRVFQKNHYWTLKFRMAYIRHLQILMKSGTEMHVWNSVTVTWPNMKIITTQDGEQSSSFFFFSFFLSFFLSVLFGVVHAPFACQRWVLPHRLAQCDYVNIIDLFLNISICGLLNHTKCPKFPPLAWIHAQEHLCHSSIVSSTTLCP